MTRAEQEFVETLADAAIEKVRQLAQEVSVAAQAERERQVVRTLCHRYGIRLVVVPAA